MRSTQSTNNLVTVSWFNVRFMHARHDGLKPPAMFFWANAKTMVGPQTAGRDGRWVGVLAIGPRRIGSRNSSCRFVSQIQPRLFFIKPKVCGDFSFCCVLVTLAWHMALDGSGVAPGLCRSP